MSTITSKLIVVIGATGKQGGSVARLFATEPGWRVRGVSRDITSTSSQSLGALGVEMVSADLDNPSTLTEVFTGAKAIFATTDFWAPFYNPATKLRLSDNQTLGEYCYEKELKQVKNIADAASKVEGLERIVVSSLVDAEKLSGGKYKGVYHWNSKARGVAYLQEQYPDLAKKMTVVIIGNYMDNWQHELKLRKQEDGSYRLGLVGSGETPLPNIDTEKDTGHIVRAAIHGPCGKTILAAGSMISWSMQLKVWCEINKVPFGGFDTIPLDVFDGFFPIPGLGRELGEIMAFMDEFGYVGGEPVVILSSEGSSPDVWSGNHQHLGVICTLTSWEDYVNELDWSHILNRVEG